MRLVGDLSVIIFFVSAIVCIGANLYLLMRGR